jgi:hypothetical protein
MQYIIHHKKEKPFMGLHHGCKRSGETSPSLNFPENKDMTIFGFALTKPASLQIMYEL